MQTIPNVIIRSETSAEEKIKLMRQDASFDVADEVINFGPDFAAIVSNVRSRPGPPKVPKMFVSNDCVFNCAYCGCRVSRDKERYTNAPKEIAGIAVREAKSNGHGVFVTSSICKNADYTQEMIIETVKSMRQDCGYGGYIHAKVMPGADPELIRRTGLYANRLSVNIEVAKSEGYERIARNKNKDNILTPMQQISRFIKSARDARSRSTQKFATSQTTQMMAGSTNETDFEILRLSGAMYRKYDLKRVYYTAFQYRQPAVGYEELEPVSTPKWRMTRLYQADRLMQLYGFTPEEIAPDEEPNLSSEVDPKAAWALRHLDRFPVEINTADYETLLRVPGIGLTYAERIIEARKQCTVTHDVLRALKVSLLRSRHFITADGKFCGVKKDDEKLLRGLIATPLDFEQRDMLNDDGTIDYC